MMIVSETVESTSSAAADIPSAGLESVHQRLSQLNSSLTETRLRADDDRRRVDVALAQLNDAFGGWDERSRHLEVILLNSSLEHCRRANAELVVDVQLTQLSDRTTAIDGKTTQLTAAIDGLELELSSDDLFSIASIAAITEIKRKLTLY